jgi:hypothetical protein
MAEEPIEGWKIIAVELRLSAKVCRRLAWRKWDPLPIFRFENIVLAYPTALRAWKQRNTLPLQVYGKVYPVGSGAKPDELGTPGPSGNGKAPPPGKNKSP